MDDRLMMENYLLVLKSTVEVFVHGTLESSNENSRTSLKKGLDTIMNSQAETYDLMASFGWYPVNNVSSEVINETLTKIENQN